MDRDELRPWQRASYPAHHFDGLSAGFEPVEGLLGTAPISKS